LGPTHLPVSARDRAKAKDSSVVAIPALVVQEMVNAVALAIVGGAAAVVMETGVVVTAVAIGKSVP
jgi:hypothetical protein